MLSKKFKASALVVSQAVLLYLAPLLTNRAMAGNVSFSGITDGNIFTLPVSTTSTNIFLVATPSPDSGNTNMVFVIERQGTLYRQFTSPPPYNVTVTNLPVGKYLVTATVLTPITPPLGDLSFDVVAASAQPFNDNRSAAGVISTLNTPYFSSNVAATSEPEEPMHAGVGAGKSVWWSWVATAAGNVSITTAGSAIDTVLAIYLENGQSLIPVASNDDVGLNTYSQVTFAASAGTKYFIAVDSAKASSTGDVQVKLINALPPGVSISSLQDGYPFLLSSATLRTNADASVVISDTTGISQAVYLLDGGGISRSGTIQPPYHIQLTNLSVGHYVLTSVAMNNAGLVGMTNIGFSVISLEPELIVESYASTLSGFQLSVTGFKGPNYRLEGSTNLDVWCSVASWTNFSGAQKITDTNGLSRRFYRAISNP